jgi:hypothetical protein
VVTPMPRREQRPQTAGHQALIKPLPLRPAVLGGYTLDDFTVDEPGRRRDLPGRGEPADQQVLGGGLRGSLLRLPAAGSVHDRRKGQDRAAARVRPSLRGTRRQADTARFQAAYRQHRPMVERSIAWLTADPTGPQRRPTRELCRQLEGQTLSIFGVSPRRWLLSAGRGPFLGCAVADCAASGL